MNLVQGCDAPGAGGAAEAAGLHSGPAEGLGGGAGGDGVSGHRCGAQKEHCHAANPAVLGGGWPRASLGVGVTRIWQPLKACLGTVVCPLGPAKSLDVGCVY